MAYRVTDVSLTNGDTIVTVDSEVPPTPGTVSKDEHLTPSAEAMHLSGGVMYWGNVLWPTRYPDVAYTESGNYTVRVQNEYTTSGITVYGPSQELQNVSKVMCGWHLEVAKHVYVKDGTDWRHYRRLTPSEQGLYVAEDEDSVSNYVFDASKYETSDPGDIQEVPPGSTYIDEGQVVVQSRINRPLEITSNGFAVKKNESVRALMEARLAEEEGLRAYDFYIGTGSTIYVAQPDIENDTVTTQVVSNEFGVGLSAYNYAAYTAVPQGLVILDTQGVVRVMSGRQQERIVPDGAEPWNEVYDVRYHLGWDELAIGTDEGIWFFDWDRRGIFRQYDIDAEALLYDEEEGSMLAWDGSAWQRLAEGSTKLDPSVTTQEIESGGRELTIRWAKVDYDKTGYENTDRSTMAEIWQTVRNDDVMGYDENPDMIVGQVTTTQAYSVGATSINVSVASGGNVDLKTGDVVRLSNHDRNYTVTNDVTISGGNTGTINIDGGLVKSADSGTKVRPRYRGIFKVPRRERVRPPFRGTSHQIRLQKFNTLRDIQILAQPRINYE